jgi:hypothetical protein
MAHISRALHSLWVPLLAVSSISSAGQSAVPAVALTALVGDVTGNPPAIEVQLTNTSQKTMTAWAVETTFIYADQRPDLSTTTHDCYPLLAVPTGNANGPLPPGKSVSLPLSLTEPPRPLSVRVTPPAVVYDDQTAEGDPSHIERIFMRRSEDLLGYRAAIAQVRAMRQQGVSITAIQNLVDDLRSSAALPATSSGRNLAASNLAIILRESSNDPAQLERRTARVLVLLELYERAAQIHSVRK